MNAGYVRLSRDDDKRNYVSIENQMLIIRQYAAEKNTSIDRWYEDDGISGYIFDRPGFNQLMADLEQDIDTVFVKDFSRLGRHNARVLLLLDEFKERGKQLIVIDDAYDSADPEDDTIGIKTWYNERYVKDTSKKIRRALGARQKDGTLMTQPPFGYRRNEKDKTMIEVSPEEAAYVRLVFDLYLKGAGCRKIAAYLNEHQIPTPSMARHVQELKEGRHTKRRIAPAWSDGMVKEILDNDFYIGTFRLHKRERATIHGKDRRVPREQQHTFENHHPPVIDKLTFDLVKETKAKRARSHYRGSRSQPADADTPHPFGGCLFCKDCGSRLTPIVRRTKDRERKYYICSTYNTKGKHYCSKAHLIEEQDLMTDVISYITLCRNSLQDMITAYDVKDFKPGKNSANDERADIRQMISAQKKQLKAVFAQKVKDLAISPDNEAVISETYASLQQDILAAIQSLETRLETLSNSVPDTIPEESIPKTALEIIDDIINTGRPDRKDIELLIEHIVVDENGLPEIVLKYSLPGSMQCRAAEELNRRQNNIICTAMKLILADARGYTSAKRLSAALTAAGYEKTRKSVLPYIRLLIAMGIITPSDNPRKPYTIIKTPAAIRELVKNFPQRIPSGFSCDPILH